MTSAARRNVTSVCLSSGRVTTETGDVRIQTRRNRKTNAATVLFMTRRTRGVRMFRVVKPRVETAQRRKRFYFSALHVCVADGADLAGRI